MLHTIRVLAFVRQAACGHGFDHFLSYRIKSSGSDQNQDKHEHLVVCTEEFHQSTNLAVQNWQQPQAVIEKHFPA
jgi:hypothetical protein